MWEDMHREKMKMPVVSSKNLSASRGLTSRLHLFLCHHYPMPPQHMVVKIKMSQFFFQVGSISAATHLTKILLINLFLFSVLSIIGLTTFVNVFLLLCLTSPFFSFCSLSFWSIWKRKGKEHLLQCDCTTIFSWLTNLCLFYTCFHW